MDVIAAYSYKQTPWECGHKDLQDILKTKPSDSDLKLILNTSLFMHKLSQSSPDLHCV